MVRWNLHQQLYLCCSTWLTSLCLPEIDTKRSLIVSHLQPFGARVDIEIIKAPRPVCASRSGTHYEHGDPTSYIHFIINQACLRPKFFSLPPLLDDRMQADWNYSARCPLAQASPRVEIETMDGASSRHFWIRRRTAWRRRNMIIPAMGEQISHQIRHADLGILMLDLVNTQRFPMDPSRTGCHYRQRRLKMASSCNGLTMFYDSRRKRVIREAEANVGKKLLWSVIMLNTANKTQASIFDKDPAI